MDDPEELNINLKIIEGLYYIETDNFSYCVKMDVIIIL